MISGTAGPMMSKALRLRLPNYTEEIATGFSKLLKAESMTDVTLICNGGQTIRAHQVILATFSPYFRAIFEAQPFTNNPCQYPVIVIKDLAYPELRAILEFIYRGEVSISRDKLPAVLQAAKALEISGLSDLRVESALNGVPTSSTSASSTAADSSDLMDSTLLASLTGAHHSHNSMAALNAVNNGSSMATSNGTGNKRPHESMMNCTSTSMFPGSLDSLKKARLALDQNGSMPMDRLGMGLLNENGLNNVAAYNRFGQNPFNLNRSLDRTIIELMQQQNQQLKRFSENNNRAMTVEQFLAQRQMRQQKMMQQRNQQQSPQTDSHSQSNGNNSKQQILQQHLMQKNSSNNNNNNINNSISNNNGNSISKSPPTSSTSSSSDKPVATSPNCNSSPERLTNIKRDDSPKPASSSSPGADDGDRPEDMSKSKTTMTSSGDEARSIDPSSSSSCSDAEQSIGTGTGCNGEIDDKLDQESGQHDDAGDLGSNDMDSNNNNNSSSSSSGSHNGANNNTSDARNDDDERPLQLTIETNTSSDDGDKRSYGSDGKRTPKSPMTQDCGASHNGDHNGSVDDDLDQDGNSPVKQEIDIEEDPIMLNTNVDDMSEYMDQDDMNGESEDYDIQANKESESKFWLRQQQLRLAQLQRQQYNHLLQLQADQQEAKLIEFYEQLQQANTIGRFPQDPDVDPSTVISLDWKEGFMDDSCPDRSGLDSIHPLANSLAPINRSLVGLMSAQNGLIGRDLKNSPSSNLNGTSNGGTNNGQTGGTPLITPDFLQPRGPGRPRKGNKAQDISPCPECNKVFVRPDVLKLHYRSVHLNERHPCNLCPKIFKWPGDLSKHKRTKHPEALAAAAAAKAAI